MKKLFLFLALTALLSSCSSDNNGIFEAPVNKETKYKLSFDIKSDGFSLDKTPLRDIAVEASLLQIVVYKESGEVYSNTVILKDELIPQLTPDGSIPFSIEVPFGVYHVTARYNLYNLDQFLPGAGELSPENYYTDIFTNGSVASTNVTNYGIYYETVDVTVSDANPTQHISMTLDPMWSEVYLTVEDASSVQIPTGIAYIGMYAEPRNYGLEIHSKLGFYPYELDHKAMPSFSPKQTLYKYTISKTKSENNNLAIKFNFINNNSTNVEWAKTLELNRSVENGYIYRVSGKIGSFLDMGNSDLKVTLSPFNEDEVIDLPFE